jgi:hypothetical protein
MTRALKLLKCIRDGALQPSRRSAYRHWLIEWAEAIRQTAFGTDAFGTNTLRAEGRRATVPLDTDAATAINPPCHFAAFLPCSYDSGSLWSSIVVAIPVVRSGRAAHWAILRSPLFPSGTVTPSPESYHSLIISIMRPTRRSPASSCATVMNSSAWCACVMLPDPPTTVGQPAF